MINTKHLSILFFYCVSSIIMAQGTPSLQLVIDEEKLNLTENERAGNSEILYMPGDTIRYTIRAINNGTGDMVDPEVIDPIPDGVQYIERTASGEGTQVSFSIDNGNNFQTWPITYTTVDGNGKQVVNTATAEMVTHIKWDIFQSLSPGEERLLFFNVIVK